ncbi:MAG: cytidylyltransferase domain-containing protein [Pikeienuella sp.]|uniref:cytidylyltransferase domain-containing protein n=1 Tax=Pikeienuella sp. TaxID=2831957 RepID=UPI00391BEA6A
MRTAAIILARGGSKGVPGKNLRPVGGVSLVGRSVRAARGAEGVDAVFVSTDDEAIAAEARRFGAVAIARPAEISGDAASSESGWLHALEVIRAGGAAPEALVFLQCTSPFTTPADIDGCLAAMAASGAECALAVRPDHGFLWTIGEGGLGHGVNHDETKPRQRRQDLPPQYVETGAVYAVRTAAFEAARSRFCGRVALHVTDHPPVEIDSFADLALCERIAAAPGAREAPPERLRVIRAVVMDFDGVHTDDRVTTDQNGVESVRSSRGDGLGLSRLREAGRWRLMILSKERNPVVARRAEKLGIEALQGIDDKVVALGAWLAAAGIGWEETLFVGNDVNDLPAMRRAGLSACPADSWPAVLAEADWVLPLPGGRGALRVMAEALLDAAPA